MQKISDLLVVVAVLMYNASSNLTFGNKMAFNKDINYYKVLGVQQNASEKEIRKAYHKLALEWHPDKNKSADAKTKFTEIATAHEVLSNSEERKKYDDFLKENSSQKTYANFKFNSNFNYDSYWKASEEFFARFSKQTQDDIYSRYSKPSYENAYNNYGSYSGYNYGSNYQNTYSKPKPTYEPYSKFYSLYYNCNAQTSYEGNKIEKKFACHVKVRDLDGIIAATLRDLKCAYYHFTLTLDPKIGVNQICNGDNIDLNACANAAKAALLPEWDVDYNIVCINSFY